MRFCLHRLLVHVVLWSGLLLSTGFSFAQSADRATRLLPEGADPWVLRKDGFYYYTHTTGRNLTLWKTRDLSRLAEAESQVVWIPPAAGPNSWQIWAPELHFLDGRWYIYYTATDAAHPSDLTRFVFVLENTSPDPLQGTWIDKGRINTQYSGLDGSVFEHRGKRYFLYSAYVGPQSRLFISEMVNPWTLSDRQVEIARPTQAWEKYDGREICEGPQFLRGKKGKLLIVYSASACWDDNYALGLLSANEKSDLLAPVSWTKSPRPVFSKSEKNGVYGPGHNCFTQSADGRQDWIVYHAKDEANGRCEKRSPRFQAFGWNADGSPDFGLPAPVSK